MHHALLLASRAIAALVALVAFYFAFFLYEDDEGIWQNRLENLWISVYDRAKVTDSTSTALFNKIGEALRNLFARLFGNNLFSVRAVAVSANLSLCGVAIEYILGPPLNRPFEIKKSSLVLILSAVMLGLTALPSYSRKRWAVLASYLSLAVAVFDGYITATFYAFRSADIHKLYPWVPWAMLMSVLSDFLVIVVMRKLFASITKSISILRLLGMIVVVTVLALSITFSPFIALRILNGPLPDPLKTRPLPASFMWWSEVTGLLVSLNLTTILACLLPLGMLVFVLLHKLVWPALSRLIYPLTRHRVLSNRKFLVPLGTLCIAFALNLEPVSARDLLKLLS